jgi:hypothetical protein
MTRQVRWTLSGSARPTYAPLLLGRCEFAFDAVGSVVIRLIYPMFWALKLCGRQKWFRLDRVRSLMGAVFKSTTSCGRDG